MAKAGFHETIREELDDFPKFTTDAFGRRRWSAPTGSFLNWEWVTARVL
jgi:hypothetical protein